MLIMQQVDFLFLAEIYICWWKYANIYDDESDFETKQKTETFKNKCLKSEICLIIQCVENSCSHTQKWKMKNCEYTNLRIATEV